jgi:opacity protein-like surface antigen
MQRLRNSITYEVWKLAALAGASLEFLVTSFLLLFVVAGVAHADVRAFITLFYALFILSKGGGRSGASETKDG